MESTRALLLMVREEWAKSSCREAQAVARELGEALQGGPLQAPHGLACPAPPFPLKLPQRPGDRKADMLRLIRAGDGHITWKNSKQLETQWLWRAGRGQGAAGAEARSPGLSLDNVLDGEDKLKSAMLVGTPDLGATYQSDKIYVGLAWFAPGVRYPPHAHDAAEVYQVLTGEASWGPVASHLSVKVPGEFIYHAPCQPHAMHVPLTEPLLAIWAWTGQITGKFWFGDPTSGDCFAKELAMVRDPKDFYNQMAETYEEVVRGWGYNMPEIIADKLAELVDHPGDTRLGDLGCGEGMVGAALAARGFTSMLGLDLSPGMLAGARARGVYHTCQEADLLAVLPLQDGELDVVTCVGTSTYLNPSVLAEWLRVTSPGGLLAFTHKTGVVAAWEEEQQALERAGAWTLLHRSEPLYYLPSGPKDPSQERVFVFIYRKL